MPLSVRIGVAAAAMLASAPAFAAGQSLGLALTSWTTALYETPDAKEECPSGLTEGALRIYIDSLPSAEERATMNKLTRNAQLQVENDEASETTGQSDLRVKIAVRGPQGKSICYNPTDFPVQNMQTVRGKKAYGMDLDKAPGAPATCAHEEFTSPDGKPGIDHQWYRLVGCSYGWRTAGGFVESNPNGELRDRGLANLVQVTGIDDFRNDDAVDILFTRSLDPLYKDGAGNILPHASYRADPQYNVTTRGKIVDGVLMSDPVDVHFPFYGNDHYSDRFIRGVRLQLTLTPDGTGAKGLVGGYVDIKTWWDYTRKLSYLLTNGRYDCPALYQSALQLADGYPDANGKCTALSAAYKVDAVSGFIVFPQAVAGRP